MERLEKRVRGISDEESDVVSIVVQYLLGGRWGFRLKTKDPVSK